MPNKAVAVKEGLTEDELALFDLLQKSDLTKADRERLKLAAKSLLESIRAGIPSYLAAEYERPVAS